MTTNTCGICVEAPCICGEAYKDMSHSQLEILIPILIRQFEATPEFKEAKGEHGIYTGAQRSYFTRPWPAFGPKNIDSHMYFGHPLPENPEADAYERQLRYDMLMPGLLAGSGDHRGTIVSVEEHTTEECGRYKIIQIEVPMQSRQWYAVGPIDNYNWPNVGNQFHVNIRINDLGIELPDELRHLAVRQLADKGHEHPNRKLHMMFGAPRRGSIFAGFRDTRMLEINPGRTSKPNVTVHDMKLDLLIEGVKITLPAADGSEEKWSGRISNVETSKYQGEVFKILSVTGNGETRYMTVSANLDNAPIGSVNQKPAPAVNLNDIEITLNPKQREELPQYLFDLGYDNAVRAMDQMFGIRLTDGLSPTDPGYYLMGLSEDVANTYALGRLRDLSHADGVQYLNIGVRRGDATPDRKGDFEGDALEVPLPWSSGGTASRTSMALPRRSLGDIGRFAMRPRDLFSATDFMKYRRLSPGAKFQFLEAAGADFVGEWVVTGFVLFDEDDGPKLQVASVVAMRGEQSITFYTSYSTERVDEQMVPFVSMEHIEILNDSWDIVEEPSVDEFKTLKVGKFIGITHLPPDVKLEIVEVEYRQKNYGLVCPEQYMAIIKLSIPAELRQQGDDQEFFTFWTVNLGSKDIMFVPGVTEYIPLTSIVPHDQQ